jgi:hypothetical protein
VTLKTGETITRTASFERDSQSAELKYVDTGILLLKIPAGEEMVVQGTSSAAELTQLPVVAGTRNPEKSGDRH